jgi:hypothetical protein
VTNGDLVQISVCSHLLIEGARASRLVAVTFAFCNVRGPAERSIKGVFDVSSG